MENFKEASRQQLRFQTSKGSLSTEQLWSLSVPDLDNLAVALEAEYNESGKKSFVVKRSTKDRLVKLRFDIVLDVLNTIVDENQKAKDAAEVKEHNKKILTLISEKTDESLKGKSVKQLEAMLK